MRILLAFRVFFRTLFDRAAAERIRQTLAGTLPAPTAEATPVAAPRPAAPKPIAPPARSEALTLLAALQREARFVDIVKEPLAGYSDAQIGAAARQVLQDCGNVLQRMFDLAPVVVQEEGSAIEVPSGYDPLRYNLSGHVTGQPPYRGKVVHHGWMAQKCELPAWSGNAAAAPIIAPIEVEIA